MTVDATLPGALGTLGWDDEGCPAQRVEVVKEGRFVGYLTDRENASRLSPQQHGAGAGLRLEPHPPGADDQRPPEPGTWTLDDLVADTDDGLYLETNRSWSIDDRRLNFRFGTEGLRDQGREAGGPAEERHLHRDHPGSGATATPSATRTTGWPGAPPTGARGSPRRRCTPGTGRPGPLPQRPGRGGPVIGEGGLGGGPKGRCSGRAGPAGPGRKPRCCWWRGTRPTRFAENQIHQHVAERDVDVRVRVALGKKVGAATVNGCTRGPWSGWWSRPWRQLACSGEPGLPASRGRPLPETPPGRDRRRHGGGDGGVQGRPVGAVCRRAGGGPAGRRRACSTAVREEVVANSAAPTPTRRGRPPAC